MRGRARAWLLSFRCVVDDVEAAAAGRNNIRDKLGAFGANVSQCAACHVEVRKLIFDGTAGQGAQRLVDVAALAVAPRAAMEAHSVHGDVS